MGETNCRTIWVQGNTYVGRFAYGDTSYLSFACRPMALVTVQRNLQKFKTTFLAQHNSLEFISMDRDEGWDNDAPGSVVTFGRDAMAYSELRRKRNKEYGEGN